MIFTEADLALVQLAHETLAQVVAEKRSNREFLPPAIDEKVKAIGGLAAKMRDANVALLVTVERMDGVHEMANREGIAHREAIIRHVDELGAIRRERDELQGRLQAAQQATPYDPEPDKMLDWIERESWADVRYAIAPAQREEHGSLRDAIRHAVRSVHAGR